MSWKLTNFGILYVCDLYVDKTATEVFDVRCQHVCNCRVSNQISCTEVVLRVQCAHALHTNSKTPRKNCSEI